MTPDTDPSNWIIDYLKVLVLLALCQSISGNKNNTLWWK